MALDLPRLTRSPSDTMAVEVARALLDHLVLSGSMQVGDRLPAERQLAEAFGVGRSAVREALKALNLLGLVEIRQGDGTYLKRPDSELLPQVIEWGLLLGERRTLELVETRQSIEVAIARLAAERRDEAGLEQLQVWLNRMKASLDNPKEFVEADVAFHLQLAHMSKNRVLSDILTSLQSLLRVWIDRVIQDAEDPMISYLEHEVVFDAVAGGDPDASESAQRTHLDRASKRLVEALEAAVGSAAQQATTMDGRGQAPGVT